MSSQLPYRQSYQYDAFSNLTQRNNLHWGIENWYGQSNNLSYNYNPANNRISGWNYDADGRVTTTSVPDDYNVSTYDAGGMLSQLNTNWQNDIFRYYDGNGRESKRRKISFVDLSTPENPTNYWWEDEGNTYFIRSSILGNEVISEVNRYGDKIRTNVMAAGNKIATQENHISYQQVLFEHWDASGSSYKTSDRLGVSYAGSGTDSSPGELDPMGGNVGLETPYVEQPIEPPPPEDYVNEPFLLESEQPMYVNGQKVTCNLDGISVPCGMISAESSVQCPNNKCEQRVTYQGKPQWAYFTAYADGFSGYVPTGAKYIGSGALSPVLGKPTIKNGLGSGSYPNDTDLVKLNGASGEMVKSGLGKEGIVVLSNRGADFFWQFEAKRKGGDWHRRERVSDEELDRWRNLFSRFYTRECKEFLEKYVAGVDLLKVFDLVRAQGGFAYNPGVQERRHDAEAGGDITQYYGARIDINERFKGSKNPIEVIGTLIHELIHASGPGRGDVEMQDLLRNDGVFMPFANTQRSQDFASMNWGPVLGGSIKSCGNGKKIKIAYPCFE